MVRMCGHGGWAPPGWVLAGPWCACWRGGGQSVVISVIACSPSLRMSMLATLGVAMPGREEPGCRAGLVVDGVSWWWSVCRGGGLLADGGAGGRIVGDGLAGGACGHERGYGEPVDGAGQAAGVGVDGAERRRRRRGCPSGGQIAARRYPSASAAVRAGAGMW